jgi:uncharacterized protein
MAINFYMFYQHNFAQQMNTFLPITLAENSLLLHANRALILPNQAVLVLSDLHLGKSGHFRKSGIAIPQKVLQQDLFRLFDLIQFFSIKEVIIVGDFFHSNHNSEHNLVARFLKDAAHVNFTLVKGNHDVLNEQWYIENSVNTVKGVYTKYGINFVHDNTDAVETDNLVISGHIHPVLKLDGKGKQSVTLPCFYFENNKLVLPAFGKFTGGFAVKKTRKNRIFVLTNNHIQEV